MGHSIRDYEDINENLRFWFNRVFGSLADPVFYDIGANDGVFSLGYAARCRVVHAFEPAAVSCARLAERCAAAGIENIVLHRVALGEKPGTMTLYGYSDDTFNSLYQRPADQLSHYSLDEGGREEVPVARLDDLVAGQELPAPDVVKIDIEGAELHALRGGERTISEALPVILVEYSVDNTANAGYERTAIRDLLLSWDYDVRGLYRNTDTGLRSGDELGHRSVWNLLCFPPGSRFR